MFEVPYVENHAQIPKGIYVMKGDTANIKQEHFHPRS